MQRDAVSSLHRCKESEVSRNHHGKVSRELAEAEIQLLPEEMKALTVSLTIMFRSCEI